MKTVEFTRNRGTNRGKPRLWIEGAHLVAAGLDHGNRFNVVHSETGFKIVRAVDGKRKIAGKPGRPIIDISASGLGAVIGACEVARITYAPGSGTMTVSAKN